MADEIFRIESLRAARVKQAQTAQHVLAAIVLMSDGWTDLTAPKPHWVFVSTAVAGSLQVSTATLIDGDSTQMLGMLSGGVASGLAISPDRREIYMADTYYSRGSRGD